MVDPIKEFDVVVKTMDDTPSNRTEIDYALGFTEDILNEVTPHFVLTWESKLCPSFPKNKLLLFSELFENDLNKFNDYLLAHADPVKLTLSMIAQTFMGISTLYDNGLAHDDLHGGNILYKRIADRPTSYFLYHTTAGRTMAIQHQSHLFALTDYGFMKPAGQIIDKHGHLVQKNMLSDFERICSVMSKKIIQDFPELGVLLKDISIKAGSESRAHPPPDPFTFLQDLFIILEDNRLLDQWMDVVKFKRQRNVTAEFNMK
jgi:hypothetical protein